MTSTLTNKLIRQLGKESLSTEDRSALTVALLTKLNTLPIQGVFHIGVNTVSIKGKPLDIEQTIAFRDSALALKDNVARKIIHEQVRYAAVETGIKNALTTDTIMFSKAALWCLEEMDSLLELIA